MKTNLITKIKSFLKKVGGWFKVTSEESDKLVSKYAPIAVDVLQKVKTFNDSAAADSVEGIIVDVCGKYGLTAGATMTLIRTWLKKRLPLLILSMGLAYDVSQKATIEEKLKVASQNLKDMNPVLKSNTLQRLSADLTSYLEDGRLSVKECIQLVIDAYNGYKNKITK